MSNSDLLSNIKSLAVGARAAASVSVLAAAVCFQFILVIPEPASARETVPWSITREAWTTEDERLYSEWVQKIGESGCNTVNGCLSGPGNYIASADEKATYSFTADCGRFPFLLRAYFAWKRGLPFSVVSAVRPAVEPALFEKADVRYSKEGNVPTARKDFLGADDGAAAVKAASATVFTAMIRMSPELDINGRLFPDFYSTKIDRSAIRPGTVMYDPAGHVAVVYSVENNGLIRMIDAHPDFSVSRITYDKAFARSRPNQGAGFKNFRPLKRVDGRVVTIANKNLSGFGLEQYYGTKRDARGWFKGIFEFNGKKMDYYEYVRTALAVGDLKFNPLEELKAGIESLCESIQYRVQAVQEAVDKGIALKAHPAALPKNIYGTDGEWESFSTPSRDARLKISFLDLRSRIASYIELYRRGDRRVIYSGSNLPREMRETYTNAAAACLVQYRRTNGSVQAVSFDDVVKRMYRMSFDPYHCPELRWGASDPTELETCRDDQSKRDWYSAEQGLRNQTERTYDARMDFSLQQLRQGVPGSGVSSGADVDLKTYLEGL